MSFCRLIFFLKRIYDEGITLAKNALGNGKPRDGQRVDPHLGKPRDRQRVDLTMLNPETGNTKTLIMVNQETGNT